eukprot:COSAG05_NODE_9075_length_649_cov_1.363636_1_plen_127_part_10
MTDWMMNSTRAYSWAAFRYLAEQQQQQKLLPHVQTDAALKIQARQRGRRDRRRALSAEKQRRQEEERRRLGEQVAAAVRIQTAHRGRLARGRYRGLSRQRRRHTATLEIQRQWRGFLARCVTPACFG